MSAPLAGLRVLLVARANRRYHRTGLALADAWRALGAEPAVVDPRGGMVDRLLRRDLAARLRTALAAARPDLVMVFKGEDLVPPLVASLRTARGERWTCWFPDDPHAAELGRSLAPAYDAFFTHDSASVAGYRALGVAAHYLPFGVDPDFFRPMAVPPRWRSRIAFVGSHDAPRAHVLAQLADLDVATWGPRWPRGPVHGEDYVRALAGAEVGLNLHQHFGPLGDPARYGAGANMRLFELAATGTPQVVDAKADVARHLEPGREVLTARSVAELREVLPALAADAPARAALAAAARTRVLREHTWAHRLEELAALALR